MALAQVGAQTYSTAVLVENKVAALGAGSYLLFNFNLFNPGASVSYVQFFDAVSTSVTVGATTPTFVLAIPAGVSVNIAQTCPKGFRTGVTVACTSSATGSGAPVAAVVLSFDYVSG